MYLSYEFRSSIELLHPDFSRSFSSAVCLLCLLFLRQAGTTLSLVRRSVAPKSPTQPPLLKGRPFFSGLALPFIERPMSPWQALVYFLQGFIYYSQASTFFCSLLEFVFIFGWNPLSLDNRRSQFPPQDALGRVCGARRT